MLGLSTGKNLLNAGYQVSRYIGQALQNERRHRNDDVARRRRALQITSDSSKKLLEHLGVEVNTQFSQDSIFDRNYFIVCNHMSYFDILVLSSVRPAVFVTSVEMEKTFFLGDMAKWGGSFFVNRVNRRKMKEEVESLIGLLNEGFNVFIFPEGTSTNGSEILPFKKSLFRVPYQTGFPILPVCLKYTSIDGEPFSQDNCDRICWHGDMTFAPHFLQLMTVKKLQVNLEYLNPLNPQDFESHGELAAKAEELISSAYFSSEPLKTATERL